MMPDPSRYSVSIAAAMLAMGCAATPAVLPRTATSTRLAGAHGTLTVAARAGFRLQASDPRILPFAKRHLQAVHVLLTRDGATDPDDLKVLGASDLDLPLRFDGLTGGATYRITVRAWQPKDANARAVDVQDLAAAVQVDAESVTTFVALAGETVDLDALGGIRLTLADRVFDGRTTGGISFTPGVLDSTPAGEGIKR